MHTSTTQNLFTSESQDTDRKLKIKAWSKGRAGISTTLLTQEFYLNFVVMKDLEVLLFPQIYWLTMRAALCSFLPKSFARYMRNKLMLCSTAALRGWWHIPLSQCCWTHILTTMVWKATNQSIILYLMSQFTNCLMEPALFLKVMLQSQKNWSRRTLRMTTTKRLCTLKKWSNMLFPTWL